MYTTDELRDLLAVNEQGHVRRRESSVLEFKANFTFAQFDRYAKTLASFSNNRGGVIVFGVTNHPRIPRGMTNERFDDIDPERVARELNNTFNPEIRWYLADVSVEDRRFGFLVAEEAAAKPVVAKCNAGDAITEGAVYFRYNGRNELIKHAEMRAIIDGIKAAERRLWMNHLKQIAHIGPEHAGVFNPDDGLVTGPSGSFIIDRALLPEVQFIRDGAVIEKEGSPSVRIMGHVHVIEADEADAAQVIGIQEKAINQSDIIVTFLNRVRVRSPQEYLKQISLESIKYLPFYYYCRLAGMSGEDLRQFLADIHAYATVGERLDEDATHLPLTLRDTGTRAYRRKIEVKEQLEAGNVDLPKDPRELRYCFEVLRTLRNTELIRKSLQEAYKLPLRRLNVLGEFRIAVCYLDFLENSEGSQQARRRVRR